MTTTYRLSFRRAAARAGLRALGYTSRRVPTPGGHVNVVEAAGRGGLPTVVLLHGLGSRGADYLPLLARLRGHVRRVIAPDLPGHGDSDEPAAGADDAAVGAPLFDALDAVLDEPAVIYGNSLGGLAALRLAVMRARHVRGLLLASPAGAPSTPEEVEGVRRALRLDTHTDALGFLDRVRATRPRLRHAMAWGARRRLSAPTPRDLVARLQPAGAITVDELGSITVPVTLLWGREERLLPHSHLAFFRSHLPAHARIEEPSGMGHGPQLDDPDDVARRILELARSCSR